ncbi:RES domain-containing protein [Novosphingobium sp. FGD1]|uniref:RES domain-containing protein n=1 Tax=Novosphingobium silvae TaxID=2692619 RepID=A0A7X4GJ54_9SPHN|nr:RES family NAD+ phosphorylase [Novosphingobium silvae]MYL98564.1 RES domain-containing protein [Novosphingobium silvae]
MDIPLSSVRWRPCYRIVPTRFPPVSVFDDVADPADLEAVFLLEAMTNDRLREEAGDLSLVPPEERVSGPGSTPVMAAFTHLNPGGDRFTDGSFGVFYAARSIDTALAETKFHRSRFMAWTREPGQELDMRVYAVNLDARMHDIRRLRDALPDVYDPDSYGSSQALALKLRAKRSDGIVYGSVRHEGGECAAVFRPRLLSNCRQERHLCYVWNGEAITTVYEKRAFEGPNLA